MIEFAITDDPIQSEQILESIPDAPAVFLLFPHAGKPYLFGDRGKCLEFWLSPNRCLERVAGFVNGKRVKVDVGGGGQVPRRYRLFPDE